MHQIRIKYSRKISIFLLFCISFQILYPLASFGLTDGPTQPEVNSFTPIGTNDMVDLFTGDFSYNIPLMEVGDYPLNLIYNSNPTADQEASWVGLGWNVNPGAITRNMRGLPDDFCGDVVKKEFNIKPNKTLGIEIGSKVKLFGLTIPKGAPDTAVTGSRSLDLNFNVGINSNNYKGYGLTLGLSPSLNASKSAGGSKTGSLGFQASSQDGLSLSASVSNDAVGKNNCSFENKIGLSYNTRAGLSQLSITRTQTSKYKGKGEDAKTKTSEGSLGSTISFGYPTFCPTMNMPMRNKSFTFNATIGSAIWGVHPDINVTGFWSEQSLQSKIRESSAYGYLNSEKSGNNLSAMHDFNREKDEPYHKSLPSLPLTNFSYDLFSISGQGISGQFRSHRGDVGIIYDRISTSDNESTSGGVEIGVGGINHFAANIAQVSVTTTSRQWKDDNSIFDRYKFFTHGEDLKYENSYFKFTGENAVSDSGFYTYIGNENPVVNPIIPLMVNLSYLDQVSAQTNSHLGLIPIRRNALRNQRDKRSQYISFLNSGEIPYAGLNKIILTHTKNVIPDLRECTVTGGRSHENDWWVNPLPAKPAHLMSEITVTKPDGKRYVYGIPTYNIFQRDVTFACNDLGVDPDSGLVAYTPGVDNNRNANARGIDNFFSAETTPGYAYSFLLSGILSADYVDRTSNGISPDDNGEAIKFNYTLSTSDYHWRVPYEKNNANYNGGLNAGNGSPLSSRGGDAKGSYTYGEKEIWYTNSIESRTQIAVFKIEDREDAMGVQDENGGQPVIGRRYSSGQKLLRSIELYSKSDLISDRAHAVPIKTVHFVYDYTLCPNVPNNTGVTIDNSFGVISYYKDTSTVNLNKGKLTLRKVYFTYGSNTKGQLNSYSFNYSLQNPEYGLKNYDRWGNYKLNSEVYPAVLNAEFPYTLQDTLHSNRYIKSYNLESIDLPSGGTIKVDLEPDDYAYVQNRRAGQMYFVNGFGTCDDAGAVSFRANQLYNSDEDFNVVFIDVVNPDMSNIYEKYLVGLDRIYYRFFMDMGGGTPDYISGYCDIDKSNVWYGVYSPGKIWVKVARPGNDNPISKNAWQFLRNYYPEVVYPGSSDPGNNLGDAMLALLGSFGEIADMVTGFDNKARSKSWAKSFIPEKSFVRLNNNNFRKLGGGSRVKRITISDNWNAMAPGGLYKEYGQEYLYADTTNGNYKSSGVANWEPAIGNDENPYKQPVNYEVTRPMSKSDYNYMEEPFGESFFPSPVVGYSKVYVANFSNDHIRRTATGYIENTFYTAKDFPVITSRTNIESEKKKPAFKLNFLGSLYSSEQWMASQGYSIELNDMHGKPRGVKVVNALGSEVSSTTYVYHKTSFNDYDRLTDNVDVVNNKGEIYNGVIAEDIDLCMDMREENTNTIGEKLMFDSEGFIIPLIFFPLYLVIPPVIPSYTQEDLQFRSVVATKVIHKYGILDKIIEKKDGSTVEKQNILRDSETGEVLLTKTTNEFDDPIYNWTYPAHWAYNNMGPAYINTGLTIPDIGIIAGYIISSLSNIRDYLCEGDEIILLKNGLPVAGKFYVGEWNGNLRVCKDGNFVTDSFYSGSGPVSLKVVRSGRRNMQSMPIGTLTTIKDAPINSSTKKFEVSNSTKIIGASSIEYKDKWKIYTGEELVMQCDTALPDVCLGNFINALINYNLNHDFNVYGACETDSISVGGLFKYCQCACHPDTINGQNPDSMLFYSTECPSIDMTTDYAQWHFGECDLTMTSLTGNEINLDSLIPVLGSLDSSSVVVYAGVNHTDSVLFELKCIDCENVCVPTAYFVDPYETGMANNWHPYKTWSYYTNRVPAAVNHSTIRNDGYYSGFTPFWNYGSAWSNSGIADSNWIATNTVTRVSKQGTEIESKDALGIYSSAIYGYRNSFVKAITANAKLKETANDNFEDYTFQISCGTCTSEHFDFRNSLDSAGGIYIANNESHTGDRSLHLASGTKAFVERDIFYNDDDSLYIENGYNWYDMVNGRLEKFSPDSGKYVLSTWVKEDGLCGPIGYTSDSIVVSFTGSSTQYVFHPSGVVVEGWQRYDEVFNVPSNATAIKIELCSGDNTSYFDDIRVFPYHSNMKSYVYSSRTLRLMSELDANNYATFYEYDDEGHLIRVKKETERGVMTIKEAQTNFKIQ